MKVLYVLMLIAGLIIELGSYYGAICLIENGKVDKWPRGSVAALAGFLMLLGIVIASIAINLLDK